LGELLRQTRCLDEIGLDHGELTDARKHILIDKDGQPHILDFETASMRRRTRNLISLINYLFFKGTIADPISRHIRWDRNELMGAAREYKGTPSKFAYDKILACLGLC
jgi:predicted Ser/Thr protein kinase